MLCGCGVEPDIRYEGARISRGIRNLRPLPLEIAHLKSNRPLNYIRRETCVSALIYTKPILLIINTLHMYY